MKNIFTIIGRVISFIFLIFTLAILIMIFKGTDYNYVFVIFYIALLCLFLLYSLIAITINIKKLKWKKTSKLLLRWLIWSLSLWIFGVIFIYLTKGELRLTDKIFNSISIAAGSVFGGLVFGSDNNDI